MSNGQKWLLALICIGIMMIPFIQIMLPTSAFEPNAQKSAIVSPAWHTFIIPPGGRLMDRSVNGERVAYYEGDKIAVDITTYPFPKALYYEDAKTDPIHIRIRRISLKVIGSNKMGIFIGFRNLGTEDIKLMAKIISHEK